MRGPTAPRPRISIWVIFPASQPVLTRSNLTHDHTQSPRFGADQTSLRWHRREDKLREIEFHKERCQETASTPVAENEPVSENEIPEKHGSKLVPVTCTSPHPAC